MLYIIGIVYIIVDSHTKNKVPEKQQLFCFRKDKDMTVAVILQSKIVFESLWPFSPLLWVECADLRAWQGGQVVYHLLPEHSPAGHQSCQRDFHWQNMKWHCHQNISDYLSFEEKQQLL